MNYLEFRAFRKNVLRQRNPLRLDGMNPAKSMAFLLEQKPAPVSTTTLTDTLEIWSESMQAQVFKNNIITSIGVRETLKGLMSMFAAQKKELWLPDDVYPVYWELAKEAKLKARAFSTLPDLELSFLDKTKKNSVILLPSPIMPLGRRINEQETHQLKTWLNQFPDRRLVLDAVYTFDNQFDKSTLELFNTGQSFVGHSLSKGWLLPGNLGVLLSPQSDMKALKKRLASPAQDALNRAAEAMRSQPKLPQKLQSEFNHAWQRLCPKLNDMVVQFKPPETGYFSLLQQRAQTLLERFNVLAIPASVFGSQHQDLSVISCLPEPGKEH